MKKKLFVLLFFFHIKAFGTLANCEKFREPIEKYKDLIVSNEVQELSKNIHFPLQAYIAGKKVEVYNLNVLKAIWSSLVTPTFLQKLKNKELCELADMFGLSSDDNKITSFGLFSNQEDSKYSYSGISSELQLKGFVDNAVYLIEQNDAHGFSKIVKYPFGYYIDGKYIEVSSEKEFSDNFESILANNKIDSILRDVSSTNNFVQNPKGVMLNEEGDVWVVDVYGELKIVIVNTLRE